MKFWLRKPGTLDFIGPLTSDDIRAQIQSGSITWDFEALEATGQSHGALRCSTDWVDLSSVCPSEDALASPSHASTAEQEQSPSAFLQAVRRRSCYGALRGMIELLATFSICAIVILVFTYVIVGLKHQSGPPIVIGLAGGVLGCILVIASRQASLLLVDIVDTLIEQNRKKKRDTE